MPDHYDPTQPYIWNYEHAPEVGAPPPAHPISGNWTFAGRRLTAPWGVAAGPLLNGRWCLYYAARGFDVVTYKTVRTSARACYPLPNLVPVACGQLGGEERELAAAEAMAGTWAVSFGMPSASPEDWRADLRATRAALPAQKVLVVSVVGSVQPAWTLDRLAADYAQAAAWAVEAGADAIEANFSCPNVSTCDGQLYQQPHDAQLVAARIRDAIGRVPLILKIGHLAQAELAAQLLDTLAPYATALATTNSVATLVRDRSGTLLFGGQKRGICGAGIRTASIRQVAMLRDLIDRQGLGMQVVGVGGISHAEHVRAYLAAGATHVQLATAAMREPEIGLRLREQWGTGEDSR